MLLPVDIVCLGTATNVGTKYGGGFTNSRLTYADC